VHGNKIIQAGQPDQALVLLALGSHENFYRDLKR